MFFRKKTQIDLESFIDFNKKLNLDKRKALYLWYTACIIKHINVRNSQTLLAVLQAYFIENVLCDLDLTEVRKIINEKTKKNPYDAFDKKHGIML